MDRADESLFKRIAVFGSMLRMVTNERSHFMEFIEKRLMNSYTYATISRLTTASRPLDTWSKCVEKYYARIILCYQNGTGQHKSWPRIWSLSKVSWSISSVETGISKRGWTRHGLPCIGSLHWSETNLRNFSTLIGAHVLEFPVALHQKNEDLDCLESAAGSMNCIHEGMKVESWNKGEKP